MPGSAMYLDRMVNVEGYDAGKSPFMLTTVYLFKGSYFFQLIQPFSNFIVIRPEESVLLEGETKQEYDERQKLSMKESKQNAINAALLHLTLPPEQAEVAGSLVNFNSMNISGPSAGLVLSLEIVRQFSLEQDLSKGYKIAGTGTIDKEGAVGRVGSVRLKVKTALKKDAEIFFVPNDANKPNSNFIEAQQVNQELGNKLKVVPVSTLAEALEFLEALPTKFTQ